jgi:hypothetical protein
MIKYYDIKAFITLSHQNRLFGQISSVVKEGIVLYKFTFANSDYFICIKKAADQWTFVSGMHNPNESWINEIGKQIDQYENDHLSQQA